VDVELIVKLKVLFDIVSILLMSFIVIIKVVDVTEAKSVVNVDINEFTL
jgi:hypothetical protein